MLESKHDADAGQSFKEIACPNCFAKQFATEKAKFCQECGTKLDSNLQQPVKINKQEEKKTPPNNNSNEETKSTHKGSASKECSILTTDGVKKMANFPALGASFTL